MNQTSLADFVIESGAKTRGVLRDAIRAVGSELVVNKKRPHSAVKRFVLNDKAKLVLSKLNDIPFQEFAEQFSNIVLPFDKFWIEDVPYPETLNKPGTLQRKGFLIRKQGNEIRARLVTEIMAQDSEQMSFNMTLAAVDRIGGYMKDRRWLITDDIEFVVNEKGLTIDASGSVWTKMGRPLSKEESEIDGEIAEAIFRLLVLVSSKNVASNMIAVATNTNIQDAPIGSLIPIEINLTPKLEKALSVGDHKTARKLLGWTDVSRHTRTYYTRNGSIKKTIEPHDRRIAAPIDRRGVTRVLGLGLINYSQKATIDARNTAAMKR